MTDRQLPPALLSRIESSDQLFVLTPEEIVLLRRWQEYYPVPTIPKLPTIIGGFGLTSQMLRPLSIPIIADRLPAGWKVSRLIAVHHRVDDLLLFTEMSCRLSPPAGSAPSNRESEGGLPPDSGSPEAALTPTEADALRLFELARREMGCDSTIASAWEHLTADRHPVGSLQSFKKALTRARAKIAPPRSGAPRSAVPVSHFNRDAD